MIAIVLITHGEIGQTMVDVASRLVSFDKKYIQVVSSCAYKQQELLKRVKFAFDAMPDTSGYLVLTDLFGATPTNVTQFFMHQYPLAVISGLNMPMLLKALTYCKNDNTLEIVAKKVYESSRECIVLTEGQPDD
ncbi:PTS sugar transporter subunit IIA [Fangia hongkongensis]|uniref:PTS sugar transporter subunit IIA n=1 Tax=Fangia hongkongensis TaxID=270495 RepID=UPI00038136E9|nr:hypothetical protein [Fangia hongkongensis]MBK2125172.1 hypothetical protein [Fangia hongkongensis]